MRRAPICLLTSILFVATGAEAADAATQRGPDTFIVMLHAGDSLEAALAALNAAGHRVMYSSALVRPEMRLRASPTATRVEELLREILAPWNLRAVQAANGDWLVTAETAPAPASVPPVASAPEFAEPIETVSVVATRMRLAIAGASESFLDRADVESMPHLADDALRALKILPGVSGGDYSAAVNIRGGRREEALLSIDGAEIHNGFHFRDIDNALSVLDTRLVDGIDFITGGMTADTGDYMSGVVGLQTRRPTADDEYRNGVGISFVSAYGHTSGTFAQDRGSWMLSARRGFLDVLTAQVMPDDEQLTPRYMDVFGAVDFDAGERTRVGARVLFSDDDLKFRMKDNVDDIHSAGKGHSLHLWFTLDHDFSDELRSHTLLAAATVNQQRESAGTDDDRAGSVHSDNDFQFLDLRQDWTLRLGDRNLPRWGFNVGRHRGDYDYAMASSINDPLAAPFPIERAYGSVLSVKASKLGVYGSWRTRIVDGLTAEAGARWDRVSYDRGLTFEVVSPRLNFVYSFDDSNELRAAWGIVHQSQGVNELQVEDNVTEFFAPERVQQIVLGYMRRFGHGLSARLDIYDKQYSNLRTRFENGLDPIQMIPEGALDRVRIEAPEARARGVELTIRREAERGLSGWLSLAFARAEDHENDTWVPRSWEQQQTLSFGSSWTGEKWNVSLAGLMHSGTPTTFIGVESIPLPGGGSVDRGVVGPRNEEHLSPYARIDLRANRDIILASSRLSIYLEVTNLLDRQNECCIERYHAEPGRNNQPVLVIEKSYWLPLLPSLGFQWEF